MMFAAICVFTNLNFAQTAQKIPSATIKKLNLTNVNTSTFSNKANPMLIFFWATWDSVGTKMLERISESYTDWQSETGVKIIVVSIDDARSSLKVKPLVEGKGWKYDFYLDENQDFARALKIKTAPHIFLINGKGEVAWNKNTFAIGEEDEIYEYVEKVKNGQAIN